MPQALHRPRALPPPQQRDHTHRPRICANPPTDRCLTPRGASHMRFVAPKSEDLGHRWHDLGGLPMTDKSAFAQDEWDALTDAPLLITAAIFAVGEHGPISMLKEASASARSISRPGERGVANE